MASTSTAEPEFNVDAIRQKLWSEDSSLALLLPSSGVGKEYLEALVEFLQAEINDSLPTEVHLRKKCMRYLKALATKHQVLPRTLFIENIMREGDNPLRGGGYADIWKGFDDKQQPLCLKVLRMFTGSDQAARDRVFVEALVWKQLKHPNILPFLGVNTTLFAPGFCMVSPWMANGDIVSFVKTYPAYDKLALLYEVSSALNYLHSLKPAIVHGDIKGGNILISDDFHCCLADFGLAIAVESQSVESSSSGALKGSLRWLAPELLPTGESSLPNQKKNKPQRDIYAFACMILEIMTGNPPFAELSDGAVLLKVVHGVRPERPVSGWCPDVIWDLVEQCWDQDPRKRPLADAVYQYFEELIFQRESSIGNHFMPRRHDHGEPDRDVDDDPELEFFSPAEWVKVRWRIDLRIMAMLCVQILVIARLDIPSAADVTISESLPRLLLLLIVCPASAVLMAKRADMIVLVLGYLFCEMCIRLFGITGIGAFTPIVLSAAYFPCALYYLTFWFKPDELPVRIAIMYSIAQARMVLGFGPLQLLAKLVSEELKFRVLFLLIFNILLGLFFSKQTSPQTAEFLDDRQRRYVVKRLSEGAPSTESQQNAHVVLYSCYHLLRQPLFWSYVLVWCSHAVILSTMEALFSIYSTINQSWVFPTFSGCLATAVPLAFGLLVNASVCNPFKLALGLQMGYVVFFLAQIFVEASFMKYILLCMLSASGGVYTILWSQRLKTTHGTIGTGLTIALTDTFAKLTSMAISPFLYSDFPDSSSGRKATLAISVVFALVSILGINVSGYLVGQLWVDDTPHSNRIRINMQQLIGTLDNLTRVLFQRLVSFSNRFTRSNSDPMEAFAESGGRDALLEEIRD
ncbi:hypothetical protein VNI00_000504 [Paramarasmius palmivorus]|uniref:Protein kinase domain-containing protein n=1 Tax=Paramarasmius palmivorus TaxID=297713 RepID=A0AAW0EBN0_9AGAR